MVLLLQAKTDKLTRYYLITGFHTIEITRNKFHERKNKQRYRKIEDKQIGLTKYTLYSKTKQKHNGSDNQNPSNQGH